MRLKSLPQVFHKISSVLVYLYLLLLTISLQGIFDELVLLQQVPGNYEIYTNIQITKLFIVNRINYIVNQPSRLKISDTDSHGYYSKNLKWICKPGSFIKVHCPHSIKFMVANQILTNKNSCICAQYLSVVYFYFFTDLVYLLTNKTQHLSKDKKI